MTAVFAWLAGTRIGRWIAMVGAALALLAGAVLIGWSKRGQAEAGKAADAYIKTRKRVDDEDYLDGDLGLVRDRLRDRGER